MENWSAGGKYGDFLEEKNANIRGRRGHFHCTSGENIILEKKGLRQKYPILGKYIPLRSS